MAEPIASESLPHSNLSEWEEKRRSRLATSLDLSRFSIHGLKRFLSMEIDNMYGRPSPRLEPKIVWEGFEVLAHNLKELRDDWCRGDERMHKVAVLGTETGGFEDLVRRDWPRQAVERRIGGIRDWLVPFILPYCDTKLRERVLAMLRGLDVDAWLPDSDGQPGMRWRQTWSGTGMGGELKDVVDLLRAAGDAASVAASRTCNWRSAAPDEKREIVLAAAERAGSVAAIAKLVAGEAQPSVTEETIRSWIKRRDQRERGLLVRRIREIQAPRRKQK